MRLEKLIEQLPIKLIYGNPDAEIEALTSDSRKAGFGTLFAAFPGANDKAIDGHDFLTDAYERGSRVFLTRADRAAGALDSFAGKKDITILGTHDTRQALALMSRRFFGYPEKRLKLIALTGTKGKTTISYMLKSIFEKAGKKAGIIGSNGVTYPGFNKTLPNTTPEAYDLHGFLKDMADSGVEYCFVEATSQGFMLHRTDGIEFDAALYTNISPDHISATEHPSFEHYFDCKKLIFSQTSLCYVNRDAELFKDMVAGTSTMELCYYGFSPDDGGRMAAGDGYELRYTGSNIKLTKDQGRLSVGFCCEAPAWRHDFRLSLPGRFNADNALAAICLADHFGIDPSHIAAGLEATSVAGRMEQLDVPAPYTVIIDYAHNKLSAAAMMETAKSYNPNRVLCVFGLDGGRAHIRRFDCGEILGREADYIILSDASPKDDDPDEIMADTIAGIERGGGAGKYEIIHDRFDSIPRILDMADEGDIVLLVGEGDRTHMTVRGIVSPIDERQIVREYFSSGL